MAAAPPDAGHGARGPARGAARRVLRIVGAGLAVLVLAVAAAIAALAWALHHPAGSAWLLDRVPGLHVEAPSGSLIGDFAAAQIVYRVGSAGELRLKAPRWRGLALRRGDHGRWLHLVIDDLHVDQAVWIGQPARGPSSAPTLPDSLRLPLELEIHAAQIDELRIGSAEATPIRDVHARVHLGADDGAQHRLDDASARVAQGDARGAIAIGADAPFPVEATLDASAPAQGLSATLHARGPLSALATDAQARIVAAAGHPAQAFDAHAVIHPLAPWPLGELHASASALDLSAFTPALPATSLSGSATVATSGIDVPAVVSIELQNARAGRWNEGLLPVRSLRAELRARPDNPRAIDVQTLVGELGSASAPAGRITGRGQWQDGRWNLDAELRGVRPTRLDARAAEAVLDGKVTLASKGAGDPPRIDVTAALDGVLSDRRLPRAATAKAARLRLDATVAANEIELRHAEATLGDAAATLAGTLSRRAANDPWHAAGRFALKHFDPAPWWPGAPDALLGRGANRLDAQGEFDLSLPGAAAGDAVYALLAATTGSAHLTLLDSVLAGVPLSGSASFVNRDGQARPTLDLLVAGNRLHVDGTLARAAAHDDDWRVAIDAPHLDAIAPLVAASDARPRGSRPAAPALAGTLTLHGHVAGRWPDVTSDGELQAKGLRGPSFAVASANGRWRLGSRADAPVEGTLVLDGIDAAGHAIERVEARLAGSARAHRIELRVASALLPPAWTDALAARSTASATATAARARLRPRPRPASTQRRSPLARPQRPRRPRRARPRRLRRAASSRSSRKAAWSTSTVRAPAAGAARSTSCSRARPARRCAPG